MAASAVPALPWQRDEAPRPATVAPARRRFESVDGLRGVAVALVFLSHLAGTHGFPRLVTEFMETPPFSPEGFGVKLFFVLSGFLTTSLLLRELDASGSIDWRAFLGRRSRRLFPTYFAFVLIVGALRLAGVFSFGTETFVRALTFTNPQQCWELGHLWSMAVQEQFYIVWPLVLLLGGRRAASWCAVAAVLIVPLERILVLTVAPEARSLYLWNAASVDTLALGCLWALHRERLRSIPWLHRVVMSPYFALGLFIAGNTPAMFSARLGALLQFPLVGAAAVLVAERALAERDGWTGAVLRHPALLYLGRASFSLYLWQQLFLNRASTSPIAAFPLNFLFAVAAGLLSWHLFENPITTALARARARQASPAEHGGFWSARHVRYLSRAGSPSPATHARSRQLRIR